MRTLLFKVVRILNFTSRVTRWERSAALMSIVNDQDANILCSEERRGEMNDVQVEAGSEGRR